MLVLQASFLLDITIITVFIGCQKATNKKKFGSSDYNRYLCNVKHKPKQ